MKTSSTLIAAVLFIGFALMFVGVTALIAPGFAASVYGLSESEATAQAYVRATGARDLVIGCWFLLLIAIRTGKRALGGSVLLTGLIPVFDAINVWANVGTRSAGALALHGSSVFVFIALGLMLWRGGPDR